jgi:hypothetical protein
MDHSSIVKVNMTTCVVFPIEFDPFKDHIDVDIDLIADYKWRQLAKENLGESPEIRKAGLEALKV